MPTYHYRAVSPLGQTRNGQFAAANETELTDYLQQSGLELIAARMRPDNADKEIWRRKTSLAALAVFAAQLFDLLSAGLPLIDALHHAQAAMEDKSLKHALQRIVRDIQHGVSLSASFARHPRIFPAIFLSILSSGEASGDLTQTFAALKDFAEAQARWSENFRRAMRYPLFLICIAIGVVSFMMIMVIPQVIQFLQSLGSHLPLVTRCLIAVSQWFVSQALLLLAMIVGLPITVFFIRRYSTSAAIKIDEGLLRLPVIGVILRKLALARFTHSLGLLFHSGGALIDCLAKAKTTAGNRALQAQLDRAQYAIEHGEALSRALQPVFPPFALHMLRIGEESGKIGKSLQDIARAYDHQAADAIDRFIGGLEPALTLLIGGILAWVVLAVFGPVYGSLAKLTGAGG